MSGTQSQDPAVGKKVDTALSASMADIAEVAELTSRVTNVSLDEEGEPETSGSCEMVSNTLIALPPREIRLRTVRAKSVTSFVSCPSTPEDSMITVTKTARPINSYFMPIDKPRPSVDGREHVKEKDDNPSTDNNKVSERPFTPNILEGLISNDGAHVPKPVLTSSQTDSESDARGSKRKRNASALTNNYEVSSGKSTETPENPEQVNIGPDEMDEMSKMLFEESGRPAITITSQVSDNRSSSSNPLSVSFQIPVRTPERPQDRQGGAQASTSYTKQPVDPGTPWMRPLEQEYYNTARASVVAEVRARHRSKMLDDLTREGMVAPWALHVAPMPVYLHPHAARIAEIMNKQAMDLQLEISHLLHDHSVFQAERVAVDKVSLRNIFSVNEQGYKQSVGALFDARTKVQQELKEQMEKYTANLMLPGNQVSKKELTSMVRGKIPEKYSHNTSMAIPGNEAPEEPEQPVGDQRIVVMDRGRDRSRSRSRSRRRGRSNQRPTQRRNFQEPPRNRYNDSYNRPQRPNYNEGYDQYPRQQDNYQRQQDNYPRRDGYRNRNNDWQQPNRAPYQDGGPRAMDTDQINPGVFTPDIIKRIAEAYDGLHQ